LKPIAIDDIKCLPSKYSPEEPKERRYRIHKINSSEVNMKVKTDPERILLTRAVQLSIPLYAKLRLIQEYNRIKDFNHDKTSQMEDQEVMKWEKYSNGYKGKRNWKK
jgi:hypothetical protein